MTKERVSIKVAAERVGVSADTVRWRLRSGELVGERQPTPQGFIWLVELLSDALPSASAEATGVAQAASALVGDALEGTRLQELERLVGELRGERDAWRGQAKRDEEAARELRILVRQAQSLAQALPATSGATEAQSSSERLGASDIQSLRLGTWRRLHKFLGGP